MWGTVFFKISLTTAVFLICYVPTESYSIETYDDLNDMMLDRTLIKNIILENGYKPYPRLFFRKFDEGRNEFGMVNMESKVRKFKRDNNASTPSSCLTCGGESGGNDIGPPPRQNNGKRWSPWENFINTYYKKK